MLNRPTPLIGLHAMVVSSAVKSGHLNVQDGGAQVLGYGLRGIHRDT